MAFFVLPVIACAPHVSVATTWASRSDGNVVTDVVELGILGLVPIRRRALRCDASAQEDGLALLIGEAARRNARGARRSIRALEPASSPGVNSQSERALVCSRPKLRRHAPQDARFGARLGGTFVRREAGSEQTRADRAVARDPWHEKTSVLEAHEPVLGFWSLDIHIGLRVREAVDIERLSKDSPSGIAVLRRERRPFARHNDQKRQRARSRRRVGTPRRHRGASPQVTPALMHLTSFHS